MEQSNFTDGWKLSTLGDLCNIQVGKTPRRDIARYWDGEHPWVAISDLNNDIIVSPKEGITSAAISDCRCKIVQPGTLLFSFKLSIGKMAFAGVPLYTNEAIAALTIKDGNALDLKYLYWALKYIPITKDASDAAKGMTLNQASLKQIMVPHPATLAEQRRIVARIQELSGNINKAIGLMRSVRENVLSLFQRTLELCFNEDALSRWREVPATDLFDIVSGQADPLDPANKSLSYLGPEHIESGTTRIVGGMHSVGDLRMKSGKYAFSKEHVIYSKIRPALRKVSTPDFSGLCSADMYALKPNSANISRRFLAYLLLEPRFSQFAVDNSDRNAMPKINQRTLMTFRFRVPTSDEQADIVRLLDGLLEKSKQLDIIHNQNKILLDAFTPALLDKAFRGEL